MTAKRRRLAPHKAFRASTPSLGLDGAAGALDQLPGAAGALDQPERVTTDATPAQVFLAALAASCNVTLAARASGLARATLYAMRARDPSFAAAWADSVEIATDALVHEARRRAMDGYHKPVISMGKVVSDPADASKPLMEVVYSDKLLELLLRGHRPSLYRDSVATTITVNTKVDIGQVRTAVMDRIAQIAQRSVTPTLDHAAADAPAKHHSADMVLTRANRDAG